MKGSVKDMVGAIPGAKLLLRGASEYTFETGSDGSYTVTGLPEGQYSIEVLKPGYARLAIGQRKVEAGKTARADFHLQLGGIRETVNVAGDFAAADSNALAAPQRIRISGNVQRPPSWSTKSFRPIRRRPRRPESKAPSGSRRYRARKATSYA